MRLSWHWPDVDDWHVVASHVWHVETKESEVTTRETSHPIYPSLPYVALMSDSRPLARLDLSLAASSFCWTTDTAWFAFCLNRSWFPAWGSAILGMKVSFPLQQVISWSQLSKSNSCWWRVASSYWHRAGYTDFMILYTHVNSPLKSLWWRNLYVPIVVVLSPLLDFLPRKPNSVVQCDYRYLWQGSEPWHVWSHKMENRHLDYRNIRISMTIVQVFLSWWHVYRTPISGQPTPCQH